VALVALLTFGCSACLAFGFLAYLLARLLLCSPFWANFALLGSLARLLPRRFVILSGVRKHKAKNPYFKVQSALQIYGYFAIAQYDKTK